MSPNINVKNCKRLLKVEACGVCATDRKAFMGAPVSMQLPRMLGHECSGTLIEDLGPLPMGMRVALWPAVSCGACYFCSSQRPHLCQDIQLFGRDLDGGFTETLSVPARLWEQIIALPLPATLSCHQAVFVEPLACVLHGLAKEHKVPARILIFGAGLMGRLAARAASCRWPGAEIFLHDVSDQRRTSLAGGPEVLAAQVPADLIFVACSSVDAVRSALEILEPGGTVILFSGLAGDDRQIEVDHNRLHRKEQILTGSYGCTPQDMAEAIEILAEGHITVDDLITRVLPLADLSAELARSPQYDDYKTIIVTQ